MSHSTPATSRFARWLLLLGAVGIPLSLLWDYSWESTIGIDLALSPPHIANYAAVAIAALAALGSIRGAGVEAAGVRLGRVEAPLGSWLALWGAIAFATAFLFDRWWQAGYGLAAGIWHPPQLLKAAAFFAITIGAWLAWGRRGAESLAAGTVLAMVFMVSLAVHFANRQHSAAFYQVACAGYLIVLVAVAVSGRARFSATTAALAGMLLVAATVWVFPLLPGSPQVAPIYHPRDHLLPPPFPPLLFIPALALDALLRLFPGRKPRPHGWATATESGLAFFAVLLAVQWPFSRFLLSPGADHWFFAGGGKQWPFFLHIARGAETDFWKMPGDDFNLLGILIAAALAVVAARIGLAIGGWMQRLRR